MRRVSEPSRSSRNGGAAGAATGALGAGRIVEAVAKSADGVDEVGTELLANARDEHLDGVRVTIEILIVDMLDQLGARYHLALVVHQIAQELVFLRGQPHRLAAQGDAARAR